MATLSGSGIGLRSAHLVETVATRPAVGWLEVHAENYFGGGPALRALERLRATYPLSVHGVGLSLAGAEPLDARRLRRLCVLVERLQPALVSEHLAWTGFGGAFLNSLLPVPYTEATLALVCRHVEEAQDALRRPLLVENPSSYLRFEDSCIPEAEFLAALVRRTGCRLLCDVNNIYVTSVNLGLDPIAYLDALPGDAVDEIHLAGHAVNDADGRAILIDDHGSRVAPAVWALYGEAVARFGARPALVEWDTDVPALTVLLDEARRADAVAAAVPMVQAHALAR